MGRFKDMRVIQFEPLSNLFQPILFPYTENIKKKVKSQPLLYKKREKENIRNPRILRLI